MAGNQLGKTLAGGFEAGDMLPVGIPIGGKVIAGNHKIPGKNVF